MPTDEERAQDKSKELERLKAAYAQDRQGTEELTAELEAELAEKEAESEQLQREIERKADELASLREDIKEATSQGVRRQGEIQTVEGQVQAKLSSIRDLENGITASRQSARVESVRRSNIEAVLTRTKVCVVPLCAKMRAVRYVNALFYFNFLLGWFCLWCVGWLFDMCFSTCRGRWYPFCAHI